jgi:hypothetical protein
MTRRWEEQTGKTIGGVDPSHEGPGWTVLVSGEACGAPCDASWRCAAGWLGVCP